MNFIYLNIKPFADFISRPGKILLIYALGFFGALSGGLLAIGMIFYLRGFFNATQGQIGFFASLWSVSYIIGCLFLKRFHGRFHPQNILLYVSFSFFLIVASITFARSFVLVFMLYALLGLATSLYWPIMTGWLSAGYEGTRLGKIMSGYNFSWSTGTIISPFLGGLLSEYNISYPLYAVMLAYAFNAMLMFSFVFFNAQVKNDKTYLKVENKNEDKKDLKDESSPLRFVSWIGIVVAFFSFAVIINVFPIYGNEILKIPKSEIGLILLVRALFTTLAFLVMGTTSFWQFNSVQMRCVTIVLIMGMVCMNFLDSTIPIMIILSVIGLCFGAAYFNSQFHGVAGSVNRSARAGTHEILLSVGVAAGSIGGGMIFQKISMHMVYYVAIAVLLAGLIIQQIFCCKFRKTR